MLYGGREGGRGVGGRRYFNENYEIKIFEIQLLSIYLLLKSSYHCLCDKPV